MEEIPPLESKIEELRDESKKDDSKLELEMLPSHLKYVFLEEYGHKHVIISNSLYNNEEQKLVEVLKKNQKAMGWALSDLKVKLVEIYPNVSHAQTYNKVAIKLYLFPKER